MVYSSYHCFMTFVFPAITSSEFVQVFGEAERGSPHSRGVGKMHLVCSVFDSWLHLSIPDHVVDKHPTIRYD